jgi:hypothetical protein
MADSQKIVTFESMLIGYAEALNRFEAAASDPIGTYNAAFEALNWAVAIDQRIREHWLPGPGRQRAGWDWPNRLGYGAEIIDGVRFVRNSVHHQWSDAMLLHRAPGQLAEFSEWVWRPADDLPQPDRKPHPEPERAYRELMEGRPVKLCLDIVGGAFRTLQRLLEPHTIRRGWSPEDLPFPVVEQGTSAAG